MAERQAEPTWFVIALIIAIGAPNAFATDQSSSSAAISNQENEELEQTIIIGLGGATEMELRGRVSGTERNGTFVGGELVFDLMFWPTSHFGLWLEPSYAVLFRDGVSHSLGATGGMLVGW